MPVQVTRLLSNVTRLFYSDRARAAAPFRQDAAEHLAREVDAMEVGIQAEQRQAWIGRKGRCILGTRRISIEDMHGNEHELGVTVEGDTADAIDVLREVWAHLAAFDSEGPTSIDDVQGEFIFTTTAIFHAEKGYREVMPLLGQIQEGLRTRLATAETVVDASEDFKIEVPVVIRTGGLGGLQRQRQFRLERRFTAPASAGVWYCVSPLPSPEHRALIESLFS